MWEEDSGRKVSRFSYAPKELVPGFSACPFLWGMVRGLLSVCCLPKRFAQTTLDFPSSHFLLPWRGEDKLLMLHFAVELLVQMGSLYLAVLFKTWVYYILLSE